MLRDGEINPDTWFNHNQMAANLTKCNPSRFFKGLGRFLAGNIGEFAHS